MGLATLRCDLERRNSSRMKLSLRGKIAYNKGSNPFDCTIRDISETGARVQVPAGQIMPTKVVLIDTKSGDAYEGEVKWRAASHLGISFLHTFSLEELPAESLLSQTSPRLLQLADRIALRQLQN